MRYCATLLLLASAVGAPDVGHAQMTMPASSVDTRPVTLTAGIGNSHHVIRTSSPEAQRFFDQGMDYLFAFNHDEARRAFQKAAELDPRAAMPLWGVALAVGPNYNDIDIGNTRERQAFEAIATAKRLVTPGIEADYVEAMSARFAEDTHHDLKVQGERYAAAMARLVSQHPDDLDAATLYAESLMDLHPWQLWTADGKPVEGTETIVATLQRILLRDPNHIGANHFLIHAVEASSDPSVALASAERLKTLAPAAGHLVHMPAHIYQRIGDFDDSAIANRRAIVADDAYIASQHLAGVANMYDTMYLVHNIHFLASSCSMEGDLPCATKAASRLVVHVTPGVPQSKQSEWFLPTQVWVMVRFARWDEILKLPIPPKEMPYLTAMYHYARGAACTATAKPAQAAVERRALAESLQALPADAIPDFNNPARSVYELALTVLDARIAEAAGGRGKAIVLWRSAVAALDTFAYNEPADWYYPVRESLGGALLRDHQPAEAEAVFRRDLELNPGSGRSLFGLWQSLLAEHRDSDAGLVKIQLDRAWAHATVKLDVAAL